MLGVVTNPTPTPADEMQRSPRSSASATPSLPPTSACSSATAGGETVDDPYFGGAGPRRAGCIQCGPCMTGCPHNAKNRRDELPLPRRAGRRPGASADDGHVRASPTAVATRSRRAPPARCAAAPQTFTADQVVFAAGTLGTQKLLHQLRTTARCRAVDAARRADPHQLRGDPRRRGARRGRTDYAQGVAITSSIHPDAETHIEAVPLRQGQNAIGLLNGPHRRRSGRSRASCSRSCCATRA